MISKNEFVMVWQGAVKDINILTSTKNVNLNTILGCKDNK